MAVDEAKIERIKKYLEKQNLTPEESGQLAGELAIKAIGGAFMAGLEDSKKED